MDIVLDPESRVHVSIQANNGKPVPGCRVRLTDLIGSNISAEPIQDGAAEFEIGELAAGAYELTVSFENRELERLRITLKQGQTLEIPVTVDE